MAMQSSPPSYDYDVFLSFRGSDTRFGFTGNLFNALHSKGIHTFIDDRELHAGEEITLSLFKHIENSRIAIIVFSKDYASSSFCLEELSHIMECFKENNRLVLPVFFGVEPTDVRHQTGSYGEAIVKHKNEFLKNEKKHINYSKTLQKWKMALTQAANLSGYHLNFNPGKQYEYEFIGNIVNVVSKNINRTTLHVGDYRVGLDSRVLQVKSLLKMGSDDVTCIVGIHGIGGIGKTTIAREIYNSISNQFEELCFLDDVREKAQKLGLVHLQETLLYETVREKDIKLGSISKGISIIKQRLQRKKVLLILDDVDDLKQLQVMVGEPRWFGSGSRVIVTTRDTQLLANHGIETTYEVERLNVDEALELLRFKAFKNDKVYLSYEHILRRVVTHASGLPLALEVLGSIIFEKRNIKECESLLSHYEMIPHKDILKILEVSFDSLDKEEKSIFLDIACFFKGYDLREVERILFAHYGECMKRHIQVLAEKSLIKIGSCITLHDLIVAMGKEIVRRESPEDPGKRSRLWLYKDIIQVLENNEETSQIKMMCLDFPLFYQTSEEIECSGDELKNMKSLKTLIVKNCPFSNGLRYIPKSLKVLQWQRYPSTNLPSDFLPKTLSICELKESCLTSFELLSTSKKMLNIRELNLDNCQYLTHIHDVSSLKNLEIFSFQYCENLITIHDSVGSKLNKLKILNARYCSKLKSFPFLKLSSLKELDLLGCKSLRSFPEILEYMKNITYISLLDTSIEELPFSFGNLIGLKWLSLRKSKIFRLPSSIAMMPKLSSIYVHNISQLFVKHNDDLSYTVSSNVTNIMLEGCKSLEVFLPKFIPWFTKLVELDLSLSDFTIVPDCFKECRFLEKLVVDCCSYLQEVKGIPPNLKKFSALYCYSLTSSCRRMLLNQKLHENGGTEFKFTGTVRMPEWFEHQSRGPSISFWFRNNIPSIALCIFVNRLDMCDYDIRVHMFINGSHQYSIWEISEQLIDNSLLLQPSMELENSEKEDWIHAEVRFEVQRVSFSNDDDEEVESKLFRGTGARLLIETGIHVWKQKNSLKDIQFTNPNRKRKLHDYLNTAESHLHSIGEGWVEVNCVGVKDSKSNCTSACGGILVDQSGFFLGGFFGRVSEIRIENVELRAIFYGIQFAWNKGYRKVIVNSNSLSAIELLQDKYPPSDLSCLNLVLEIKIYSSSAGQVLWNHSNRNSRAHKVAKLGLQMSFDMGLISF